jgi:hypothetical protein
MISRRSFLGTAAAPLAGAGAAPSLAPVEAFFREIVRGYVRNARATSSTMAVCDFPGGTKLKSCVARSGKTSAWSGRKAPPLSTR